MKQARSFPAEVQSIGAAHRFVPAALGDSAAEVCEAVTPMVSELVTNIVLRGARGR